MQRTVSTTIRVKLHSLTNRKADLLAREYEAFQTEVHGGDADSYSATDQQASKVQRQKDPNTDTEQSVVLRNDVFGVAHDEGTVLSSWWVKVTVYDPERGRGNSIWCPAHVPYKDEQLVREGDFRDSELIRRDWYVHLVVKRSVTVQDEYDDGSTWAHGGSLPVRSFPTARPRSTARKCAVSANTTSNCRSLSGKRSLDRDSR
nr:hypothetical protein [Halolamina sediminis]